MTNTHMAGPVLDHTSDALIHLAAADEWDALAVDARERGKHQEAGIYRERERGHLTRAKICATLAQAAALDVVADAAARAALAR